MRIALSNYGICNKKDISMKQYMRIVPSIQIFDDLLS
jgi:hypothetical protein